MIFSLRPRICEARSRRITFQRHEAITELVKNSDEFNRIIEKDGKLVQKIYPIYKDPDPEHMVDFDAQFYMPAKHFLSRNIDTLYFNLGVIWSMTIVLAIALYFEVLLKIIDAVIGLRVDQEAESLGLDLAEHGEKAYND